LAEITSVIRKLKPPKPVAW